MSLPRARDEGREQRPQAARLRRELGVLESYASLLGILVDRREVDGTYWHAGNADDLLKVGGIWVSPVEVEGCLMGHPAVLECAVVGREDGQGLTKPAAHVVLRPGREPSRQLADELVAHCRAGMADYKRPRWVEFVHDLPKTATGKIQRFKLRP